MSARSAGSAKCGVPAKAIRSAATDPTGSVRPRGGGFARLAGAFLAILLELLADALALQVRQVVDEQLALEMIHLVLQADGGEPLELDLLELALHVLESGTDLRGAFHLIEDAGDGEAALLTHPLALGGQDFRVDEHLALVLG